MCICAVVCVKCCSLEIIHLFRLAIFLPPLLQRCWNLEWKGVTQTSHLGLNILKSPILCIFDKFNCYLLQEASLMRVECTLICRCSNMSLGVFLFVAMFIYQSTSSRFSSRTSDPHNLRVLALSTLSSVASISWNVPEI